MFYVLVFGLLAVVLVVSFFATWSRRRRSSLGYSVEESHSASTTGSAHSAGVHHTSDAARRKRKTERAQSRKDRRKRH